MEFGASLVQFLGPRKSRAAENLFVMNLVRMQAFGPEFGVNYSFRFLRNKRLLCSCEHRSVPSEARSAALWKAARGSPPANQLRRVTGCRLVWWTPSFPGR